MFCKVPSIITQHTCMCIRSYLYQIAHLGDDDDEPEFSSSMPLEEGDTFFFAPRMLKNLVMVDEMDSLSPIMHCQVSCTQSASYLFVNPVHTIDMDKTELSKGKGRVKDIPVITPLSQITCHKRSHSVTCHPAAVTFPPLPPAEASTRFSDPGGMQG